ncbi:MAG TPA: YjbH domain-containing protein [Longimicrobium sp.]|nr:YjbH domain-containing protein [Longimicrobium sp.]
MNAVRRTAPLLVGALGLALGGAVEAQAPSLSGTSGLISVPTADLAQDGTLTLGVSRMDRLHNGLPRFPDAPAIVQFATVGFLPFVEVGLRVTRPKGIPRQALGDRMVSVRVRALREGRLHPAVAVGVQDILGTRKYHALYVVASKRVPTGALPGPVRAHLGYGHHLPGRVGGQQFAGVFGGISAAPVSWVTALVEYDGERMNAGMRLHVLRHLSVLAALQNLKGASLGVSYTIPLK